LNILKIILLPVTLIYSLIILLRNKLYDKGYFKITKLSKPVISVGNISTGGTGKTPFVIYLAEYFLNKGLRIGIISRGYKRKSKEIVIVCDGESVNDNIMESGDELIMVSFELIKNFRGKIFVAAGADRIKTSNKLIKEFNVDLIILDDAFQHRKIHRDADIVIIDAPEYYNNELENMLLIPSGNLRERFSNLKRADLIIQNNKTSKLEFITKLSESYINLIQLRYKTEYFMDYKNSILSENDKTHKIAIVFSGIANDDSFIKLIKAEDIEILSITKYADHYNYEAEDIDFLISKFSKGCMYLTTEKDFVKIRKFENFIQNYPVYYLKLKTEITVNSELVNKLLDKVLL
jgi:tetraacyldisaccharide 4'-kinase